MGISGIGMQQQLLQAVISQTSRSSQMTVPDPNPPHANALSLLENTRGGASPLAAGVARIQRILGPQDASVLIEILSRAAELEGRVLDLELRTGITNPGGRRQLVTGLLAGPLRMRPQQWSEGFVALVEQFLLNAPSIQELYDRQQAVNNLKQQTRLQNAEFHTAKREKEEVLRQLREAKALLQAALEDIRKAQDQASGKQAELQAATLALADLQAQLQQVSQDQQQLASAQQELQAARQELLSLTDQAQQVKAQHADLEREVQELIARKAAAEEATTAAQAATAAAQGQLTQAQQATAAAAEELSNLKQQHADLESGHADLQQQHEQLQAQLTQVEHDVAALCGSKDQLTTQLEGIKQEVQAASTHLQEAQADLAAAGTTQQQHQQQQGIDAAAAGTAAVTLPHGDATMLQQLQDQVKQLQRELAEAELRLQHQQSPMLGSASPEAAAVLAAQQQALTARAGVRPAPLDIPTLNPTAPDMLSPAAAGPATVTASADEAGSQGGSQPRRSTRRRSTATPDAAAAAGLAAAAAEAAADAPGVMTRRRSMRSGSVTPVASQDTSAGAAGAAKTRARRQSTPTAGAAAAAAAAAAGGAGGAGGRLTRRRSGSSLGGGSSPAVSGAASSQMTTSINGTKRQRARGGDLERIEEADSEGEEEGEVLSGKSKPSKQSNKAQQPQQPQQPPAQRAKTEKSKKGWQP